MGAVYRCEDTTLNETVAVKLLPDSVTAEPVARERLKQEVVATRRLADPTIVRVYEYFEGEGRVGYSMEYLPGSTLEEHMTVVDESPFSGDASIGRLPWVAALVSQLARSIDLVHTADLVHRDIKPSNVMVLDLRLDDPSALRVKLLDFGVVRTAGGDLTGVVQPGTLSHMAPELIDSTGPASPASDLFALGKVVYLALTGERARYGPESDKPSSLVSGLPSSVDESILSCLATRPDRRPKKAAVLAEALWTAVGEVEEAARLEATRLAAEKERREAEQQDELDRQAAAEQHRQAAIDAQRLERERVDQRRRMEAAAAQRVHKTRSRRTTLAGGLLATMLGAVLVVGIVAVAVVGPKLIGGEVTTPSEVSSPPGPAPREMLGNEPPTPEPIAEAHNPAGIDWVHIPGGTFEMGSRDGDTDETYIREVTVPSFELGRHEVTVGQWGKCVAAGGCSWPDTSDPGTPEFCNSDADGAKEGRNDYPMNCVSWFDVVNFCNDLSRQADLSPGYVTDGDEITWERGATGFRLPSEAEWEYAARGGEEYVYSGSNDLGGVGWYSSNSGRETHEVGGKQANGYGLHDMSGNVWEWVTDCYEDSYQDAPMDGSPRTSCSTSIRVKRGGSWRDAFPPRLRVANRDADMGSWGRSYLGFRLARDASESASNTTGSYRSYQTKMSEPVSEPTTPEPVVERTTPSPAGIDVDMDNLQERGGLYYAPSEDKPFTGRAISAYDNGQKECEGEYKDGKEHGTWTFWYENGQKSAEGEYKNGKEHGPGTLWHENGQKWAETEYKDGEEVGTWTYWNEDGAFDKTETF